MHESPGRRSASQSGPELVAGLDSRMAETTADGPGGWTELQINIGEYVFDLAEQGDPAGRPVLFLHGFPQIYRSFDAVAARLAAHLADAGPTGAGLRLLALNQRGYSPGARPQDPAAYAIDELFGDVLAILDVLEIEAADVVGHDWGSIIAWNLAARHPKRV